MASVVDQRTLIAPLLDLSSPADAPTAYYALYHDVKRSALVIQRGEDGRAVGFVGRFQTGIDLFRPVIVMRCAQPEVAADLLAEGCTIGRPYLLFASQDQLPLVGGSLQLDNVRVLSIYALDPAQFSPTINVLVVNKTAPDGTPRAEINSGGLQAVAGLNWQSPKFAEMYVYTDPEGRQRRWGRSVAAAWTERAFVSDRIPNYLVGSENKGSVT